MIYNLTNIFTKINATSGTLQNDSSRYAIEISNSTVNGSGFLLFPQASTTFNGTTLYARSVGAGGAVLRYVPFSVGEGQGAMSGGGSSVEQIVPDDSVASDDDIDDVVDDIFGH